MIERYVITSATNNSPVFVDGLNTLKNYCKHKNATLIVLPVRYNPKAIPNDEIIYDSEIVKFLRYDNFTIGDHLTVLPEVCVRPTAIKPLQGLASMGNNNNTLIAHPRLHMETIASLDRMYPKFMMTTGSITNHNYTKTKLGAKATFHHTHGGVIVEIDTKTQQVFNRQFTLDRKGEFSDVNEHWTPLTSLTNMNTSVKGIVFGDFHEMFMADVVRDRGLFGVDSLARICSPDYIICHDLLDQFLESHHNETSCFKRYMRASTSSTIIDEMQSAKDLIADIMSDLGAIPVVVSSNHNSHLTQWLERADWKKYPTIARDILAMTLIMLDEMDRQDNIDAKVPDVFRLMLIREFGEHIIALDYNEDMTVGSFEISLHGDKGINGARTLGLLQNHINMKVIKAHTHSASRVDGVLTVGTSSALDRNYTYGLSTWSHTHAIIHRNNKAQLITQHPITGDFFISSVATSKGTLINNIKTDKFIPYFTKEYDDDEALGKGKHYKITFDNDVFYAQSTNDIAVVLGVSYKKARLIREKGEHGGYVLVDMR